jgi:DNA invertase Pin-like site-specific DNA recombinase
MQPNKTQAAFKAAIYIRISKDDVEKSESYSVANQRDLILSYLKSHPEIKLCAERIDDGYSGVNFDRPAIQELLTETKNGTINCIIVKDLSRFGRNYIETGRYLEQIFPFIGVRFIAINDNYDSMAANNSHDNIIVPFKNLMNDAYSRDISIKVRSQLEVRQRRGDFIGSFPVYGYVRSDENKKRLAIDEFAAQTIRDIFKWKISGMNNQKIADKLDELGVPSPLEYKAMLNWAFSTSFKLKPKAKWSAVAVGRILKNEIYTGTMVQGKETTPNYKIKKRIKKAPAEWIRVEDTHEAIISAEDFAFVNKLLLADTRTAPSNNEVYLLSGILKCANCGGNMIRKPTKVGGKEYIYYICGTNKQDKTKCAETNRISENQLIEITFQMIKNHISVIMSLDKIRDYIDTLPMQNIEVQKIESLLKNKREELTKNQSYKQSLYEDYKESILSKKDYLEMKNEYQVFCDETEKIIVGLEKELFALLENDKPHNQWIENFKNHENITELTRPVLITLVEKIEVVEKKRLRIKFTYSNEFETFMQFIEENAEQNDIDILELTQNMNKGAF